MPDRAAVLAALTEYANKPATSRDVRAEPAEVFGGPPFTTLMQFAQTLDSLPDLNALLADVAPLIRGELFRGSTLALSCGTLVEWGGAPSTVAPHLLAELPRQLALARRAHERSETAPAALFDADPDAARAAAGMRYLLLATMAVICRGAEYRQAARANPEIVEGVEALRETVPEADFVARVLGFTDDLELLVLAPNEHKGFRVRLEAVATCAHLFTLLQGELIGGPLAGEAVDQEVLNVASGIQPHEQLLQDHARFHFSTWTGLRADDTLDGADFASWVPVEGSPADIPQLDGVPVLLVGPTVLASRSWDSNFFANIHDALRSRVEIVDVLPRAETDQWLDRIKSARG